MNMKKILYSLCLVIVAVFAACEDENLPKASLDIMEASSLDAIPGDMEVTLHWQAMESANPTGYYLSWTASSTLVNGGEMEFERNTASVTVKELLNGETYTFSIQPVYGDKGRGSKISVKARPLSSRPSPTGFFGIPGDKKVQLNWTKPDSEALTEYELSVTPGDNKISISKDANDYTVQGLTNGEEYTFALTAVYPNGLSDAVTTTATPTEVSAYLWSSIQLLSGDLSGYVKVSNPVFSPDGNTMYIPTSTPNGHLFAVDRVTGNIKWIFQIATITYGGGTIVGNDGTVYQCGTDKKVYAINPADGSQKWVREVDDAIGAFPALSSNGILYCITNGRTLYAINTNDGTVVWTKSVGGTGSAVAIDASGNIYAGTSMGIFKYNTSGDQVWKVESELKVTERGSFALDGTTLYATLTGGTGLAAVDMATGTLKWTYPNGNSSDAYFPIVGPDGTIYFDEKGGDKKVYAVNADGTLKWSTVIGAAMNYCGLVLSDAGKLYGGTQAKIGDTYQVFELDAATGNKSILLETDQQLMAAATIGPDKRLYIGSIRALSTDNFGKLFALPIDANLETASWSMRGGNIQGTNRQK
jgi:outer membrane protein assembly factor BamB